MKTYLKFWTILAVGLVILSSFSIANKPTGKFKYYWWDGRHGHYGLLKVNGNKIKLTNWSSNFFRPTKMLINGRLAEERDSIVFTPETIEFYRTVETETKTKYKKVKCTCNEAGLRKIDKDNEWYIIKSCGKRRYFIKSDTLIEGNTNRNYVRD